MGNQELQIVINAQDRTESAFSSAKSGMDNFKGKIESMKPAFQKMALVGTAAFVAIGAVVKSSIAEFTESAKVTAQLNAVLASTKGVAGVTADAAKELANSYAKVTLYQDDVILSAENMLLTFTSISKDVFPDATKTVLNMSTALGQDLKSSSIQLGKALQDPIQGVSALRRVGVNFSDSQQEMIKKMVESGHLMEAQKFILKELNTEFGNSAEMAAKADPFGMMTNRVNELKEAIGGALAPALTALVEKITPIIDKFTAWAEKNPELLSKIIMITAGIAGLVAVVGTLGVVLPPIIAGFTLLLSPVGLIIAGVALLAFGVYELITHWQQVVAFFQGVWESVSLIFQTAVGLIKATITLFLTTVKTIWTTAWTSVKTFFQDIWNSIIGIIKGAVDKIKSFLDPIVQTIENIINKMASIGKSIGGGVKGAVNFIGDKLGINDGIVQNGKIISTHPDDTIVAMKDMNKFGGGGGIVVNINGGNYLSEDAALLMGDKIIRALQLQMRGS